MKELLTVLIPILVGGTTTWLMAQLKKGTALLANLPAVVQQVLVGALSYGFIKLAALLTITLSTYDPTQFINTDVAAITAAGLAFVFHLGKKTSEIAAK